MTTALEWLAAHGSALAATPADEAAACAAILDLVTAVAAAPPTPFAPAIRTAYGAGPSAMWLTGERASPGAAAFHNALVAARLDLDDGHRRARGHPGAAVIPAVLADADRLEAEGRAATDAATLRAIIVGYEIGLRVASARGFYARTGFWAGLAAAAGVGALRGLPPAPFAHALAIAAETGPHMATNTAGPSWPQPNGSDVKEGIPWGVLHGVAAVTLAEAGMTGALDLVDHAPFFDRDAILAERPRPAIHEAYTKFHAACRHCHAPADALLTIVRERGLRPEEIEAVRVGAYSGALRIANSPAPRNLPDAQYSIPYCLGLVALRGPGALLPMTEADIGDPVVEAFAHKVSLGIDPECEARFPAETAVRVTIRARGEDLVGEVATPRGEADDTPSWEDRLEKFRIATAAGGATMSLPWRGAFEDLRAGRLGSVRAMLAEGLR